MRMIPLVGMALAITAFGQTPESAPTFEVAAVRPSPRSDFTEAQGGVIRGGRYVLRHATMLDLLRIAYGMDAKTILGGPNWLDLDRFDIRAKVPAGTSATEVTPMLQTLLAERFGLAAHRDTQPVQAWALTASNHPLLKRSDGSGESGCGNRELDDLVQWTCRNITMAAFAANLQRGDGGAWYYLTDNLVVDRTDLSGGWDFDFRYSARWKTAVGGTKIVSLFDAINKLGLKLDAAMVPMPVLIVDHVNRTPTPNSADADRAFPPLTTEFEVASIKPANPDEHGFDGLQLTAGGRVNIRAATLRWLVANAWDINEDMIYDGPKFMDSDRWDIVAKVPDAEDDPDAVSPMLKTLVLDRFRLAAHLEARTLPLSP